MQPHVSFLRKLIIIGSFFVCATVAGIPQSATAAVFNVTESFWGSPASPNSLAWAIDQANTQPGPDTISIAAGLVINVNGTNGAAAAATGNATWLARITESVTIEGNGAKLVGTPLYITSGGLQATKTNIVDNVYEPAIRDFSTTSNPDIIVQLAMSFAYIGTFGADNSSIEVTITDLSADGLAAISNVYEGAKLTVSGGSFDNMVNYSRNEDVGRGVFQAYAGSTLNLSDIAITRNYPFADALDVNTEAALFFGTIQGSDATLNMENSSISDSYGAGAVAWSGGTANIVSSVIQNAGGVQIVKGALNFVNSILYMTGGDSLSQTNRIQALSGSIANITASSIFYDPMYTSVLCTNVSYQCNGMPLTAGGGSVLNVNASVALPINTSIGFPGKDSYSEYSGGDLRADQFSFIGATDAQDTNAVTTLFDNSIILTTGDTVGLQSAGVLQIFDKLPTGAAPSPSGVLVGVIPNAGSGGANELKNPIDGQPILVDVYGKPRTDPAGFRDIGAVNLQQNTYTVGGLLSGLIAGKSIVLTNNGGDDLSLTNDGRFVFPTSLTSGSTYNVAIKTQPSEETCAVTNGSGTIQTSDINLISVVCSVNQYRVGGNVSGLATSKQVELLLNGSLHTVVAANGNFQFPPVASGSQYDVTVGTQPFGQTCSVTNGAGTVAGADISNIAVTCASDTFMVGGLLSGLVASKSIVLTNNGGDDLSLTNDGQFVFPTPLTSGSTYSVAIKTQPSGESCAVTNGSGTVQSSDINQISIICTVNQYQVGGNVSGLATGKQVELLLNGSLHTVITADGSFQFPPIADGSNYDVTIGSQPTGQICSIANESGTIAGADISNVAVTCMGTSVSQLLPGLPSGGGGPVTINVTGCTNLVTARVIATPQSPSQPRGFAFPYGLVEFEANGCVMQAGGVQVTLRYPIDLTAGTAFFKEERAANTYSPFEAVISGRTVTFTLTDNGPGDDSSVVGTIINLSGVAVPVVVPSPSPRPIPGLSIYGIWLLMTGVMVLVYRTLAGVPRAQKPKRIALFMLM